jgi:hypothetical protein
LHNGTYHSPDLICIEAKPKALAAAEQDEGMTDAQMENAGEGQEEGYLGFTNSNIIFFPYYVHHGAHASEKRESVAAMEQDDQKEEAPVKKLTLQERRNLQKGPLSHPKTTALLVINE